MVLRCRGGYHAADVLCVPDPRSRNDWPGHSCRQSTRTFDRPGRYCANLQPDYLDQPGHGSGGAVAARSRCDARTAAALGGTGYCADSYSNYGILDGTGSGDAG
jgi:hypothetical protein